MNFNYFSEAHLLEPSPESVQPLNWLRSCDLVADRSGLSPSDLLAKVTTHLSLWLDQHSKNRLVYDKEWGGVISCGCTYIWNDVCCLLWLFSSLGQYLGTSLKHLVSFFLIYHFFVIIIKTC